MTNLKPCPFCGWHEPDLEHSYDDEPVHWVVCLECLAAGPICDTADDAVATWNKAERPSLDLDSVAVTKQPLPKPGKEVVWPYLQAAMQARVDSAYAEHGTYLMTSNGRDALADLLQEVIDAAFYVAQYVMEQRSK